MRRLLSRSSPLGCLRAHCCGAFAVPDRANVLYPQESEDLLQELGAVPRWSLGDDEAGMGGDARQDESLVASMEILATQLVPYPLRGRESKGIVERRDLWFEASFPVGCSSRRRIDSTWTGRRCCPSLPSRSLWA